MTSLSIRYNSCCHCLADAPVSTIPAVVAKMVSVPYVMDSLIPQNSFAGEVVVMVLCNLNLSVIVKWKRLSMCT